MVFSIMYQMACFFQSDCGALKIAFQGRDAALALHKKRPPSEVGEAKPTKRSK